MSKYRQEQVSWVSKTFGLVTLLYENDGATLEMLICKLLYHACACSLFLGIDEFESIMMMMMCLLSQVIVSFC